MKQTLSAAIGLFFLAITQVGSSQDMDLSKARAYFKGKTITG